MLRLLVATAVVVGFLALLGAVPADLAWRLSSGPAGPSVAVRPLLGLGAAGVLLVLMPLVSYRRQDVLLMLVPILNVVLAVKIVHRAQLLPRRDWMPRTDELPRAVRLPGGRGQYFLARDFAEAEHWRARWCRHPDHTHPYDTWELAASVGCRQQGSAPAALGGRPRATSSSRTGRLWP